MLIFNLDSDDGYVPLSDSDDDSDSDFGSPNVLTIAVKSKNKSDSVEYEETDSNESLWTEDQARQMCKSMRARAQTLFRQLFQSGTNE